MARRRGLGRLFERGMFAFMGPPELGDLSAPVRETARPPAELCRRCGEPRDEHEVVRSPGLTYSRCREDEQPG